MTDFKMKGIFEIFAVPIALFMLGCMVQPPVMPPQFDATDYQETDIPDYVAEPRETSPEVQEEQEGCVPGCHWDCFGGIVCSSGKVYQLGYGPRPCCRSSDPWPGDGPICSSIVLYECEGFCVYTDERLDLCMYVGNSFMPPRYFEFPSEFLKVFCEEGRPHAPGDSCENDDDCRPAAHGEGRLRCDSESGRCIVADPVLPPEGFGGNCGLSGDDPSLRYAVVKFAPNCEICHVGNNLEICLEQGCTMNCAFDEDCPEGYVCVCETDQYRMEMHRICAITEDTTTPEGRASGLTCP